MRGNDPVAFAIQAVLASDRLFPVARSIANAAMTTLIRIWPSIDAKGCQLTA
jgi:hypothetical protein